MKRLGGVVLMLMVVLGSYAAPAAASHKTAHGTPTGPGPKTFAEDFTTPLDSEWGWEIGGFGGEAKGAALAYNPVVFVHGNTEDATFWRIASDIELRIDVPRRFHEDGYRDQELWGLSYNGARCGNTLTCGSANDVNIPDVYRFIQAVRAYTGAAKVDVVAHSLGVTVMRTTIRNHPDLLSQIEDFVAIAGANHGTSVCRGIEDSWYGCDEIAPDTPWLDELNSWDPNGEGDETPGPMRYMTLYDGSGVADIAYLNTGIYDDSKSPRLEGAVENRELPGTDHNSLARGRTVVPIYLAFVKGNNALERTDGGPVIQPEQRSTGSLAASGGAGVLGGLALLVAALALALAASAIPSRRDS